MSFLFPVRAIVFGLHKQVFILSPRVGAFPCLRVHSFFWLVLCKCAIHTFLMQCQWSKLICNYIWILESYKLETKYNPEFSGRISLLFSLTSMHLCNLMCYNHHPEFQIIFPVIATPPGCCSLSHT